VEDIEKETRMKRIMAALGVSFLCIVPVGLLIA